MTTATFLPPVVRQPAAHPERSERYAHINTSSVIAAMEREGFSVSGIQLTATRDATDKLYARHQVDFRHPAMAPGRIPGTVGRLLFTNSHDGSTSARLAQGVYRQVCSNGLVVSRVEEAAVIRHTGDAAAEVIGRARSLAKNTAETFTQIEKWTRIELRRGERREFARLASMLRWGDPSRFDLDVLLGVRRAEDDRGDLWTTFNRVQENCVRGGLIGLSHTGRAATSRPLSEIDSSNRFNAGLWTLAAEFAAAR